MKAHKSREELLKDMLSIIRKNPGIRPSEINRRLNIPHSKSSPDSYQNRSNKKRKKRLRSLLLRPKGVKSNEIFCR